jgi:hypothetical protein
MRLGRKNVKTNVTLRLEMAGTEYASAAGALRKAERYRQEKVRLEGMSDRMVSEIRAVEIQVDVARREYISASDSAGKAGIARQLVEGRLRNAAKRHRYALAEQELERM